MNFNVTKKINSKKIANDMKKAIDNKMGILCSEILKDCNYFCRQDQGQLIASSELHSNLNKGLLVWSTPYARQVYYTGTPSKDVNANASLMWGDKAKAKFGKDWSKIAAKLIGGKPKND